MRRLKIICVWVLLSSFSLQPVFADDFWTIEATREIQGMLSVHLGELEKRHGGEWLQLKELANSGDFSTLHEKLKLIEKKEKEPQSDEALALNLALVLSSRLDSQSALESQKRMKIAKDLCKSSFEGSCESILRVEAVLNLADKNLDDAREYVEELLALGEQDDLKSRSYFDDLDMFARILLLQGELRYADKVMDKLARIGLEFAESNPQLSIRILRHWLHNFETRIGVFGGRKSFYRGASISPLRLLKTYRDLVLDNLESPRERIGAQMEFVSIAFRIRVLATSTIEESLDDIESSYYKYVAKTGKAHQILVFVGDGYLRLRKHEKAIAAYKTAYLGFKKTNARMQLGVYFSQPVLLSPSSIANDVPFHTRPQNYDHNIDYTATYSFSVDEEGRVENIKLIKGNVPTKYLQALRGTILRALYRPQFDDNGPVYTNNVVFTSRYYSADDVEKYIE